LTLSIDADSKLIASWTKFTHNISFAGSHHEQGVFGKTVEIPVD
jgi:hypothetical protein